MAYTCAVFPKADATLEEAQDEKFDLVCRKLGLRARPAAARRRLRVGRPGPARREALRRQRHRRDAVRAAGARGAREAIAARTASAISREIRHQDYRDVPETRLRRDLLDRAHRAHRQGRTTRRTSRSCKSRLDPTGPAAQPLHHPHRHLAAHDVQERLHQPLRLPRRRARARGAASSTAIEDQGFEVRHEENLREHYALTLHALVAQPRRALGRGRGRGGRAARRGCGGSTSPRRGWASPAT